MNVTYYEHNVASLKTHEPVEASFHAFVATDVKVSLKTFPMTHILTAEKLLLVMWVDTIGYFLFNDHSMFFPTIRGKYCGRWTPNDVGGDTYL